MSDSIPLTVYDHDLPRDIYVTPERHGGQPTIRDLRRCVAGNVINCPTWFIVVRTFHRAHTASYTEPKDLASLTECGVQPHDEFYVEFRSPYTVLEQRPRPSPDSDHQSRACDWHAHGFVVLFCLFWLLFM